MSTDQLSRLLTELRDLPSDPSLREVPLDDIVERARRAKRWRSVIRGGAVAVAVVVLAGTVTLRPWGRDVDRSAVSTQPAPPPTTTIASAEAGPPSLTVHPIADLAEAPNRVLARVTGFPPNADGAFKQCIPSSPTTAEFQDCDTIRFQPFRTDDTGFAQAVTVIFQEFPANGGWRRCEPCVLVAGGGTTQVDVPLSVEGVAGRPELTMEPSPASPGGTATLHGTHLQPGTQLGIGWCQPVDRQTYLNCVYPARGNVTVDDDGTFSISDYPLPPVDYFASAGRQEAQLAWQNLHGAPPTISLTLTLVDGQLVPT
jgi:hypothetical protein